MKWSPPSRTTWWICVILLVIGILGHIMPQAILKEIGFWLEVIAVLLLLASARVKGL